MLKLGWRLLYSSDVHAKNGTWKIKKGLDLVKCYELVDGLYEEQMQAPTSSDQLRQWPARIKELPQEQVRCVKDGPQHSIQTRKLPTHDQPHKQRDLREGVM